VDMAVEDIIDAYQLARLIAETAPDIPLMLPPNMETARDVVL